jgi:group I intron endonuclease
MKKYGIIYKITNKINGKIYIGQTTKPLNERWRYHCSSYACRALSTDIKIYGKENFLLEELNMCASLKEMNILEKFYIKLLNTLYPNGYNLKTGGAKSLPSEATKKKMKEAQNRPETIKKQVESHIGLHRTEEEKKKMGKIQEVVQMRPEVRDKKAKAMIGFKHTEEEKKKRSEAHKGNNYHTHIQWHFNRGMLNVECQHCIEQVMKEHS